MGGNVTLGFATMYPELVAAIAPQAHPGIGPNGNSADPDRLVNIPMWIFASDEDEYFPAWLTALVGDAVKARGGDVRSSIYPTGDHLSVVTKTYETPELYEWFLQQRQDILVVSRTVSNWQIHPGSLDR